MKNDKQYQNGAPARATAPRHQLMARLRNGAACIGAAAWIGGALLTAGCGGNDPGGSRADSTAHAHDHADGAHTHDSAHAHDHGDSARPTTRLEFATQPEQIVAGAPASWTLTILDAASGKPVEKLDTVHEKLMHLIVVSSDLSWFNHLHPRYEGNGRFTISTTLPRPGSYKLYADYTPNGKMQEVPQHEFSTADAAAVPATFASAADTIGAGGWMVKTVTSAPEGEPGKAGGAVYQVAMMPMPGKIRAGKDVMLHFQVRDAAGKPVTGLEPYLGAMGHAVLLSGDTKSYLHTHPMDAHGDAHGSMDHGAHGATAGDARPADGGGSDVMFHTNFPHPGLYKAWGQFQHKGKIITVPFVLNVEA